jgi:hypothetical protein
MIERQTELKRRYHRKAKMRLLKAKLAKATGPDRDAILVKIRKLSPMWTEASMTQKATTAAGAPKAERKATPKAEKKTPGRKPAAEKKA